MAQADRVHSTPSTNTSPIDDPQSTVGAPAEGVGALYVPTDVSAEDLFQAIGRLRKEAQDEIDRLLAFLDAIDDPELEDDEKEDDPDREPSLGAAGSYVPNDQSAWAAGNRDDREESLGDDEPSLGWTTEGVIGMPVHPAFVDLEDEHDGSEPDLCDEPSLGSFDRVMNQEDAWRTRPEWQGVTDREFDATEMEGRTDAR